MNNSEGGRGRKVKGRPKSINKLRANSISILEIKNQSMILRTFFLCFGGVGYALFSFFNTKDRKRNWSPYIIAGMVSSLIASELFFHY